MISYAPSSGAPGLPGFGFLFCLCVHPLSQNHQIWRGNVCGIRGACILGSATPTITRERRFSAPQFWEWLYTL